MESKQEKRSRTVGLRLTANEFGQIEKDWRKSTIRKLSEYIRNLLFGKPIVTVYRNQSIDDLIAELRFLRMELNRIGVNFNQSVKKLHVLHETPEFKRWLTTHEVEKRTMVNKLDEIRDHIRKIVETWLRV